MVLSTFGADKTNLPPPLSVKGSRKVGHTRTHDLLGDQGFFRGRLLGPYYIPLNRKGIGGSTYNKTKDNEYRLVGFGSRSKTSPPPSSSLPLRLRSRKWPRRYSYRLVSSPLSNPTRSSLLRSSETRNPHQRSTDHGSRPY